MSSFFANCEGLDRAILRPLSHLDLCWELIWDSATSSYREEDVGFGALTNQLIGELEATGVPASYHANEDVLAEYVRSRLKWPIKKVGGRWVGAEYSSILEHGGFSDAHQMDLVQAAAGRIDAAKFFGQGNFDAMESSHRDMLAAVMAIIIYHRHTSGESE